MIRKTFAIFLLFLLQGQESLSQAENSHRPSISAGYFIGSMRFFSSDHYLKESQRSQGTYIQLSTPIFRQVFFTLEAYRHAYQVSFSENKITYANADPGYGGYNSYEKGYQWQYQAASTRYGIVPKFHHLLNSSNHAIKCDMNVGIGIEKSLSSVITKDEYFTYSKSHETSLQFDPDLNSYVVVINDSFNKTYSKASSTLGISANPTTVVIDFGLGCYFPVAKRLGAKLDLSYRSYKNPYGGVHSIKHLKRMWWTGIELSYYFGKFQLPSWHKQVDYSTSFK